MPTFVWYNVLFYFLSKLVTFIFNYITHSFIQAFTDNIMDFKFRIILQNVLYIFMNVFVVQPIDLDIGSMHYNIQIDIIIIFIILLLHYPLSTWSHSYC